MQRIITLAAVLLVVQIVLAAVTMTGGNRKYSAFVPEAPFLDFDPRQVVSLQISDGEGTQVTLKKGESGWVMPEFNNAPADTGRIDELLQRLAAEKKGFAVATTPSAAPQFKVAPAEFSTHMVLAGETATLADFYVGTSAGYRRSHVRNSTEDDIVVINIGGFEIEPAREQWLDKNVLKRDRDQVISLSFPEFTLLRGEQGWSLDNPQPGETLAAAAVEELLDSVCGLSIQTLIDETDAAPLFNSEPLLEFSVGDRDGERTTYTFAALPDDESAFVLRLSNRPFFFKVYGWLVDDLQRFDRQKVTTPADPAAAPSADSTAGEAVAPLPDAHQ
ncbi:MAG: DUF4340 domain-containing protein [Desulfofustis sp.]|nr:DUF4340 domain-containing protein [Desulfofustis sp.]